MAVTLKYQPDGFTDGDFENVLNKLVLGTNRVK